MTHWFYDVEEEANRIRNELPHLSWSNAVLYVLTLLSSINVKLAKILKKLDDQEYKSDF